MNGGEHRTTRGEPCGLRALYTEQVVQASLGETRQPFSVAYQPTTRIKIHELVHPEANGHLLRTALQANQGVSRPEAYCQSGGAEHLPQLQTALFDAPLLPGKVYWRGWE